MIRVPFAVKIKRYNTACYAYMSEDELTREMLSERFIVIQEPFKRFPVLVQSNDNHRNYDENQDCGDDHKLFHYLPLFTD